MKKILILGFGSIGQGLVPVLREFEAFEGYRVSALCAEGANAYRKLQNNRSHEVAKALGIHLQETTVTQANYAEVLSSCLKKGDILVNLSVGICSKALLLWCQSQEVLYLDTCIEPWEGDYQKHNVSNCALRKEALNLSHPGDSTAVIAHGANPGLVSHLMKVGLKKLALSHGIARQFSCRSDFALAAKELGIKTILIAERDTQTLGREIAHNEFCNTWSVDGLISEAIHQKAEIGNGTHETWDIAELEGSKPDQTETTVILDKPSAEVLIKSWTPSCGEQVAMAIAHHENTSIAQFLECEGYRPTVTYAYNPSHDTWKSLQTYRHWESTSEFTRTTFSGCKPHEFDELGVLFVYEGGSYWFGTTLSVEQACAMPFNGPTTLQVTSTIAAALMWAMANPNQGVVEAENMDSEWILSMCSKHLGKISEVHTNWQPGVAIQFQSFQVGKDQK